MELNSETKRILGLVRQKTGREIEMVADPSLQVLAKAKMATGNLTAHVIVYNPNKKAVDYSIAYECGFILRLCESPEEQRLQFASTEAGRKAVTQLVTAPGGIARRMSLPDPLINQFTEQLLGGLLTQLRSGADSDRRPRRTAPWTGGPCRSWPGELGRGRSTWRGEESGSSEFSGALQSGQGVQYPSFVAVD